MKKKKKIPVRKCIGCGENKAKNELIRIVRNKESEVFIDETGKANGRGAYICKNTECLEQAIKTRALNRAFGMNISQTTYEDLRSSIIKE